MVTLLLFNHYYLQQNTIYLSTGVIMRDYTAEKQTNNIANNVQHYIIS